MVDSSVWIAHLRDQPTEAVRRLRAITTTEEIFVGDLVLLEVLQGARDERHAIEIERGLRQFAVGSMLDPGLAATAAQNYRELRARGNTLNRTADLIIGTFCIARGHVLLHDDRHFAAMEALGLRTLAW